MPSSIFQWIFEIFENVFADQSGSELQLDCENGQTVLHWEDVAGRGKGKTLGAARHGRGSQQATTCCKIW